jgi:hypothetical protein
MIYTRLCMINTLKKEKKIDKWSEIVIFESYDDSDDTYLFLKLEGMSELKMNKVQFTNYPEVLNKIKKLTPFQEIKYRTTLHTHAGLWSQDEWFSDIEAVDKNVSKNNTIDHPEKYKIGARVQDPEYGKGRIKDVKLIGSWTVLTIKFDSHQDLIKKSLDIDKLKLLV